MSDDKDEEDRVKKANESTTPWWKQAKPTGSRLKNKSGVVGTKRTLFCKECLLDNRKYYTISNGMPSDIERHRASKQHLELTITTVLSTSEEGQYLISKRQSKKGAVKRTSENQAVGGSPPKQARIHVETEDPHDDYNQDITQKDDNQNVEETVSYNEDAFSIISRDTSICEGTNVESEWQTILETIPQTMTQRSIDTFMGQRTDERLVEREGRQPCNARDVSAKEIAKEVVSLMAEMKLTEDQEEQSNGLLNKNNIENNLDEWKQLGNITELVRKVPCLEFFFDDVMSESVIRCSLCFTTYLSNERRLKGLSPYQIARKENPLGNGDLISGLWYDKNKTELYLRGGNSSWRALKSRLRAHLLCISTSNKGKQHYQAMKQIEEENQRKKTALDITKTLVKCMITEIKLKAASSHYETLVTFLHDCGVEIGQRQHSRKQMLPLLIAAEKYVDQQTSNVLHTEIECTQMYPHFYGVLDKGTVNRRTSQASYIVFMHDGKRRAYPLGAPLVYSMCEDEQDADTDEDDDQDDATQLNALPEVCGGRAPDLALNLLNTIKLKLNFEQEDLLRYCGTSADGPYQAKEFASTIRAETGRSHVPEELQFCQAVIWDAAHLLNLAATDVKDGKFGSSKEFFNAFIKRANEFNQMLARGKGFSQLELSAKSISKRASVVVPFAAQRFLSSAVGQWISIERGFQVLRKSFQTIHSNADEDFPLQYKMFGQDFVVDLLGMLDITAPLCELMILAQSVDFLHWKIVLWGKRLLSWMEEIIGELRELPRFKKELHNLENYRYQDVQLFEGWHLISQDKIVHPDHGDEPQFTWVERTLDQSLAELREFAVDLKDSTENRLENGTSTVSKLLAGCFDFEEMLVALEGKSNSDKAMRCLTNKTNFITMGRDQFKKWFSYVISLPHVQQQKEKFDYLEEGCSDAVYMRFKECFCEIFWGSMQEYGISCMELKGGKPLNQHFTSFEKDKSTGLRQSFILTLLDGKKVEAKLDEAKLIELLFTVEQIYSRVGPEFMLCLEIAISTGGSEAIAESFYAVMNTQQQRCHQSNQVMELKTKIDWLVPCVGNNTDKLVEGIARTYLESHRSPLLQDPRSIQSYMQRNRQSQVVHRIKSSVNKYPYLLQ